jgi:hypothetical protein
MLNRPTFASTSDAVSPCCCMHFEYAALGCIRSLNNPKRNRENTLNQCSLLQYVWNDQFSPRQFVCPTLDHSLPTTLFKSIMSSPHTIEIRRGPYCILKSPGRPLQPENLGYGLQYLGLFSDGLWALYMTIRICFVIVASAQSPTFMWRTWLILFAEVCLSAWEFVSLGFTYVGRLYALDHTPSEIRPCYQLVGNAAPNVDVVIPCCRESIDVVLDTVAGVLAQDYPSKQLRILVLDDGHDESLREAVEALGRKTKTREGAELLYLSRNVPAEVNSYYKAGNLQYGIDYGKGKGSSEFIASLDADMIPDREWLRKMVPHLILEDNLALACPPQVLMKLDGICKWTS